MCLEGQINHSDHPDGHNKSHRPWELPKNPVGAGCQLLIWPDPQLMAGFSALHQELIPLVGSGVEAEAEAGPISFGLAAPAGEVWVVGTWHVKPASLGFSALNEGRKEINGLKSRAELTIQVTEYCEPEGKKIN